MIVQPELPDHPDYVLLRTAVGDYAMEALVRLWGHCQNNNRGEHWEGKGAPYVEAVAKWTGEKGALFKALVDFEWVEEIEGGVNIHNWETQNGQLVNAWANGRKGGRPRKTEGNNPSKTHGKPSQNPNQSGFSGTQTGGSTDVSEKPNGNPTVTHGKPSPNPSITGPSIYLSSLSIQSCLEQVDGRIALLNDLTGAEFNLPILEREEIAARLLEVRGDVEGVDQMLRRQVALWQADPKSRQWLTPSTLFGLKFHTYYGQRALPASAPGQNKTAARGISSDRTDTLQSLAAARQQLEQNPADASLQQTVRALEAATA